MSILTKIFGDPNEKIIKKLSPIVEQVNNLEQEIATKTDEELKIITAELMKNCPSDNYAQYLEDILPRAFALVREASRRKLSQRHYDVQIIGGIILHRGQIAEMKTGEGKTLVATLPLFLNAIANKGAHLITVNDYLAKVGAGWMGSVYNLLGMTVGVILHNTAFIYDENYIDDSQFDTRLKHLKPVSRREAYSAHITYGTNNEFGFDYLRDNMAQTPENMVQRDLFYTIVDEVDSILIDEARTPLIISAPAEEATDKYIHFAKLVNQLEENIDYNIDEKMRSAVLTEQGITKMEKWLGVENIYTAGGIREVHHIEQALKAHFIFKKDKDYVVRDNEVIIVDEFTGRLMNGRRYSDGLHQAIEAKEGVEIKRESLTLATITFQNYFRMYEKLSGMTGTAMTEAEEFAKIYNLETISIPTHRLTVRKDDNDLIYIDEQAKFNAIINEIKTRNEKKQPVLIGTISIEKNERLSHALEQKGITVQILNAKNHEKEAQIIAQAGKSGTITIATNMAGRGVDIMLGGVEPEKNTPEHEVWGKNRAAVIEAGGLCVIGTERHESRRIDNQLRGRAGRQGDPGVSRFFVSTDDDLMRIFGGDRMKSVMQALRLPPEMPIENKIITKSLEGAQKRVEGNNFDTRKHLVEYDDVINKHRTVIYKRRKVILIDNTTSLPITTDETNTQNATASSSFVMDSLNSEITQIVNFHTFSENTKEWNLAEIAQVMQSISPTFANLNNEIQTIVSDNSDITQARTKITELLIQKVEAEYQKIVEAIVALNQDLPEHGKINWQQTEKTMILRAVDNSWVAHLSTMSSLRQGVGLQGYGQRDPLLEYKKEAFNLFNQLNANIQKEVVYSLFKVAYGILGARDKIMQFFAPSVMETAQIIETAPAKTAVNSGAQSSAVPSQTIHLQAKPAVINTDKIGRNDPCLCRSGKKFKKCCGK